MISDKGYVKLRLCVARHSSPGIFLQTDYQGHSGATSEPQGLALFPVWGIGDRAVKAIEVCAL
jgi:hypothetical protein